MLWSGRPRAVRGSPRFAAGGSRGGRRRHFPPPSTRCGSVHRRLENQKASSGFRTRVDLSRPDEVMPYSGSPPCTLLHLDHRHPPSWPGCSRRAFQRAPWLPNLSARYVCAVLCMLTSARRLNRLTAIDTPDRSEMGRRVELVGPSRNGHEPRPPSWAPSPRKRTRAPAQDRKVRSAVFGMLVPRCCRPGVRHLPLGSPSSFVFDVACPASDLRGLPGPLFQMHPGAMRYPSVDTAWAAVVISDERKQTNGARG